MNFLKDVASEIGNEYASLVSDGVSAGDTSGYIDTGSYIFNALCSGSIYGGCLLYTSPSPRDNRVSRMPSSA